VQAHSHGRGLKHLVKPQEASLALPQWLQGYQTRGVGYLLRLRALRVLEWEHSTVTDDGAKALARLKISAALNLANTAVSDVWPEDFGRLPTLAAVNR